MRLGPEGFDKIALLGTAPSSIGLAPFRDESWSIWGCSPGAYPICAQNRSDVFFELHRWMPTQPGRSGAAGTRPWFSPEFHTFLTQHKGPVYMSEADASIPNAIRYPYEQMLAKHGPYHFSSTIAWMLALAIEQQPKAIGLFGIDMAADSEYGYQRPACQHFVGMAIAMGIEIVLPPESDLMRPPFLYGIGELNPRHIKIRERVMEFEARKQGLQQTIEQATREILGLQGAIDASNYVLQSWCDDVTPDPKQAFSFAGQYGKPDQTADVQREAAEMAEAKSPRKHKGNGKDSEAAGAG